MFLKWSEHSSCKSVNIQFTSNTKSTLKTGDMRNVQAFVSPEIFQTARNGSILLNIQAQIEERLFTGGYCLYFDAAYPGAPVKLRVPPTLVRRESDQRGLVTTEQTIQQFNYETWVMIYINRTHHARYSKDLSRKTIRRQTSETTRKQRGSHSYLVDVK